MDKNTLNGLSEFVTEPEHEAPPPKFKDYGKILTDKIKALIFWTGLISSIISAVAYILIAIVMSVGFKADASIESTLAFAIITAFIGVLISNFLRLQGASFAKAEPQVKEVWEQYYRRKSPKRKFKSPTLFWVKSVVFDIVFRSFIILIITGGTIYIFIEASGDAMRILMVFFNLTLFAGFGMMSLTKAYDFTRGEHVAWMQHKIDKAEQENASAHADSSARGSENSK